MQNSYPIPCSDSSHDLSLGHTPTDWTLLHLAHASLSESSREYWAKLLTTYDEPVRRTLRQLVRDHDLAEELNQEFWHRFLRGDFAHATPERGRFRNLLKTALYHLVVDHYRKVRRTQPLDEVTMNSSVALIHDFDSEQIECWRRDLIDRAIASLSEESARSRQICVQILAIEITNPGLSSVEKAEELTQQLDRPIAAENYRQMLSRTRRRFAELICNEVRNSLTEPTPEAICDELNELNLMHYCRDFFDSRNDNGN
jgi:DNA-directed RNA polymerase specialized sigma24 family protein